MKYFKIVVFLLLILLGLISVTNAQVWRLNNNPGVDADFTTTLQDAIDGVSSGDTIYVEPSLTHYDFAEITKKVVIIGSGYWLAENDSTQADTNVSMLQGLHFNPGSEGSVVSGCYMEATFAGIPEDKYLIQINTDSITIERNYIFGIYDDCSGDNCELWLIALWGGRKSIIIQQNWIEAWVTGKANYCITVDDIPEDCTIRNNFIGSSGSNLGNYAIFGNTSHPVTGLVVNNNIIWGDIQTHNALHLNNILVDGNFWDEISGLTSNNTCNSNQYPNENNNQLNIDMSSVFVDHDLYIDYGYILAPGSPAIGAGINGGDCGVFGYGYDGEPYVMSGLPNIPSIVEVNFSNSVVPKDTTNLQIHFKAKSNN